MELPSGWKQGEPSNKETLIKATTTDGQVIINVFSTDKADWDDLAAYAKHTVESLTGREQKATSTGPVKMEVGGKPALRYDVTLSSPSGSRYGEVLVFTETATRFNEFACTGYMSKFKEAKDSWAKLANGLNENPPKK